MEMKKGQKQGKDYTTQQKTNLIQEEYLTSVSLYHQVCGTDVHV